MIGLKCGFPANRSDHFVMKRRKVGRKREFVAKRSDDFAMMRQIIGRNCGFLAKWSEESTVIGDRVNAYTEGALLIPSPGEARKDRPPEEARYDDSPGIIKRGYKRTVPLYPKQLRPPQAGRLSGVLTYASRRCFPVRLCFTASRRR